MTEATIGSASRERVGITFERFAGFCALAVGAIGVGYSIAFVIFLSNSSRGAAYVDSILLLAGGVLSSAVFVALYERLRETDPGFALWALALGLLGAFASAAHGGYDLAVLANPPAGSLPEGLPSSVDPRGLGTFALTGLGVLVAAALILRSDRLPRGLGYLGAASGVILLWVYIGRLVILNPKSAAVLPFAAAVGFVLNPAWFGWLGLTFLRGSRSG